MPPILGVTHTAPNPPLPPGACDCHTHVFGPPATYPLDPARKYTPGQADVEALRAHQQALGLDRVVIVQPSPYGTDNTCTLDAVQRLGPAARAVAVIDPALPTAALHALHQAGVRGIRLNLETAGQHDPAFAAQMLRTAAEQVAPLGWHVQIYTNLDVLAALHRLLATLPVPLVIDHFGRAMAQAGTHQPGFDTLLALVQSGRAYVKLSAAHRIAPNPDDAAPIATALLAANPTRMLWGSDWPHTGNGSRHPAHPEPFNRPEPFNTVDDGQAIARLRRWTATDATLATVLVDNPARLYDFPPMTTTPPAYEVFALRYAHRQAMRSNHFIGGDPHDAPMPMDYFLWLIRGNGRTIVVDSGFTAETAARRKRDFLRCPIDALALLGVDAAAVQHVVLTHLHYDHVGNFHRFPAAEFHLQEADLHFACGRHMRHNHFSSAFEVEDIVGIVRMNFAGQIRLHTGPVELCPGITLHPVPGHSAGLQCVTVETTRGRIVLASDASHFYENMETYRPFPICTDITAMFDSFDKLKALAPSPQHIIPGHDPLVMRRYPPAPGLNGIAAQLHLPPSE